VTAIDAAPTISRINQSTAAQALMSPNSEQSKEFSQFFKEQSKEFSQAF
jgi:hypothetical protein